MSANRLLLVVLAYVVLLFGCQYIVLPEDLEGPSSAESRGWSAVVTHIGTTDAGDLHIDLALRNETNDWSAMQALAGRPAVLKTADGKTVNCNTVMVGSGGHRLAPGFQMRGYTAGTRTEPTTQLIYVECAGLGAAEGASLSINYSYVTGQYNYYEQDAGKVDTRLEVSLDEVASDIDYPVAEPVEGLIQQADKEIVAINNVVLRLASVERDDSGLCFTWQTSNPGEYPSYVHVGNPPVIGADGIIYGRYETPDIVSVPITPAGGTAEWETTVAVPRDVSDMYILLSVESGKQRLFANYAVAITDR